MSITLSTVHPAQRPIDAMKIRGVVVSNTAPVGGQMLSYNASIEQYEPTTIPLATGIINIAVEPSIVKGSLVCLNSSSGDLICEPADTNTHPADGIVSLVLNGIATVTFSGVVSIPTSISTGTDVFLGTDGGFTTVVPSVSGQIVQKVGRVVSAGSIFFKPETARMIL